MKTLIFFIMLLSFSVIGCAPPVGNETADLLGENDPPIEESEPPVEEPGRDSLSEGEAQKLRESFVEVNYSENQQQEILAQYASIDPKKLVPANLLKKVILFYHTNLLQLKNDNYVTIVDYSARSSKERMFLINMKTGDVTTYQVAHGRGSDNNNDGYAERFKNSLGSHASSLGYFLTAETYYGGNGRSLRLDGISDTNSNARRRDVVVHGAKYVKNNNSRPGRSWGCPALSMKLKDKFIDRIKNGSLMYTGLSKIDSVVSSNGHYND